MRTGFLIAFRLTVALLIALPSAGPGFAVEPGEMLKDPVLEKRARKISAELRCLVCQNQSIDDSNAPLAHDLRVLVRERLKAGDSDKKVFEYVVARYGEYVLLRPPFNAYTLILWLTPLLVLMGASLLLYRSYQNRKIAVETLKAPELSADEQAELDALLASSSENENEDGSNDRA